MSLYSGQALAGASPFTSLPLASLSVNPNDSSCAGDGADAVAKIVFKEPRLGKGTGFLVKISTGDLCIMTCSHVLPNRQSAATAEAQFANMGEKPVRLDPDVFFETTSRHGRTRARKPLHARTCAPAHAPTHARKRTQAFVQKEAMKTIAAERRQSSLMLVVDDAKVAAEGKSAKRTSTS